GCRRGSTACGEVIAPAAPRADGLPCPRDASTAVTESSRGSRRLVTARCAVYQAGDVSYRRPLLWRRYATDHHAAIRRRSSPDGLHRRPGERTECRDTGALRTEGLLRNGGRSRGG